MANYRVQIIYENAQADLGLGRGVLFEFTAETKVNPGEPGFLSAYRSIMQRAQDLRDEQVKIDIQRTDVCKCDYPAPDEDGICFECDGLIDLVHFWPSAN